MSTEGRSSTATRLVRPAFSAGVAAGGSGGQGSTGSGGANGTDG